MTEAQARQAFAAAKENLRAITTAATAQVEEATRKFDSAKQALQAFKSHRSSSNGGVLAFTDGTEQESVLADF